MENQKDIQIPVFTVWKNNAILKNIFLVNGPPVNQDETQLENDENCKTHQEFEETLVVGRHPDCDIRVEHPSISRFHLRIYSKPSCRHLSLADMSSVHGTWVSGKRIEPNVRTMMNESDTLRIGGSSRVYKLHWIPLSQAYDVSNPFVPPLDLAEQQEDEDEEIIKDENSLGSETSEIQTVDSASKGVETCAVFDGDKLVIEQVALQTATSDLAVGKECIELEYPYLEGLVSLFSDEKSAVAQEGMPPDPPTQEVKFEEVFKGNLQPVDSVLEGLVPLFLGENWEWVEPKVNVMSCATEEEEIIKDENSFGLENVEVQVVDSASNLESFNAQCPENESEPRILSERKSSESVNVHQNSSNKDCKGTKLCSFWSGNIGAESPVCSSLSDAKCFSESEYDKLSRNALSERKCSESVNVHQNSSIKDFNGTKLWSFWSGNMGAESSVCSSLSDAEFLSESENNESLRNSEQSPYLSFIKKVFGSPLITSDQKSASCIWSRRRKLQSAPQILTSRSEQKNVVKPEPLSRALFNEVEGQEEEENETSTPNKENFTPNTNRSLRKTAMLNELKNLSSGKSPLKMTGSPKVYNEDCLSPSSNKKNYSPQTSLKQKTARCASVTQLKSVQLRERSGERMPLQSLFADSPQRRTETCFPDAAMNKDKCSGEREQRWTMIVDTTTLLNKEARKSLQLLEGLKGTQLIIPKIVIKDLACLKRQTSFFRRNTEVLSALEWIEDCMNKSQWWIYVQNSTEEGQPVAATPPASPYSQISCVKTVGSFIFSSALEYQPELLSPTVEDHLLDYALSFRRNNTDGQLVLLSSDVTLKIKAMAEGIICETAEEFRESLVNPFSERFLWADSCPRGQTWSCSDDFVLRKMFYPGSLKMTPKAMENVTGLKLILLHNSQYF